MIRINGGQATLGANTFTGLQTLTPSAANQPLIRSTGGSTTSGTVSPIDISHTLNTASDIDVFALRVTDTAHGSSATNLMTLYAGAAGTTSVFKVRYDGFTDIAVAARVGGTIGLGYSGSATVNIASNSGVFVLGSSSDTGLSRITAGIIGVGTGAAGNIAGGLQAATLALGGATIGSDTLAVTGSATISGAINGNNHVRAGATASFYWSGRSSMASPSNGVILLSNEAVTDFNRLQFGGTTSSFPAIARNGTSLDLKLADNSGYCAMTLHSLLITDNTNILRSTASMANGAGVSVGTLTNAPAAGNPTKWFAFNDNGTTRYIPAW